jgi:tellurite resistance protein
VGYVVVLVLLFFGGIIWRMIVAAGAAGVKTLANGGDFKEQWKARAFGMGPFEVRTRRIDPSGDKKFTTFEIEAKGLFPVQRATAVSIVTSLLDVTDPESPRPVLSVVEAFQEPLTPAFQFAMQPSVIEPNHGLPEWSRIGVVIPDVLRPPRSGRRKFDVWINLVDARNPTDIELGYVDPDSPSPVTTYRQSFEWNFAESGYEDAAENRAARRPLFVRLAVAVAMADGSFGEPEAATISKWIARQLSVVSENSRENVKQACNNALREAYAEAKSGTLSFSTICEEINAASEPADRYEGIELCLDVMAADGRAEATELELIRKVASVLELDFDELEKMKDQRMVGVTLQVSETSDTNALESALGIDAKWPPERIREHLREQFKTWNARLNTVNSGEERANVQAHLDLIAQARKKYAG